MTKKRRRTRDGLVSKVWKHQPIKDKAGKTYVPYCTFKPHVGVALFYEVCEERKCNHYRRLYVSLHD